MKCLILAAGYATRLYPLTENYPKPLLAVGEKTILNWLVDDIDTLGGVDEYVVISNHRFIEHFNKWANSKTQKITVVDDGTMTNETRLGAVCDIQFAIEKLKINDDMLVIAGDNVLDFSLTKFITYAKEKRASSIMRYYESRVEKLQKSGVVLATYIHMYSLTSTQDLKCGDMNIDGKVDLTDLTELSLSLIGDKDLSFIPDNVSDTTKDGNTNLADLARLKQYISLDITSFD